MKVRELIEELGHCDPDAEVAFSYPSHDYWRHELAAVVTELDDSAYAAPSAYHNGRLKLLRGGDDCDQREIDRADEDGSLTELVLLTGRTWA